MVLKSQREGEKSLSKTSIYEKFELSYFDYFAFQLYLFFCIITYLLGFIDAHLDIIQIIATIFIFLYPLIFLGIFLDIDIVVTKILDFFLL